MKTAREEEVRKYNEEAISHYSICDCLDLFRKIQFMDMEKTRGKKKLMTALKARILSLVMPGERSFSTGKVTSRFS